MTDRVDMTGNLLAGRFLLVKAIGRGGMGTVYAAQDLDQGGTVAVKVLTAEDAGLRRQGDRFSREITALGRVRHPNLVEVVTDGVTEQGDRWLAMELVSGRTLTRHVAGKPLPEGQIREITRQILQGLSAVHEAGLIHRDLKPGNVMIRTSPDGLIVKLLDFGIVRFEQPDPEMSQLTALNKIIGTPEFMSPELIQHSISDRQSDLYAVGISLYYMATGALPFTGKRAAQVLLAHVNEPPPPVAATRGEPLSDTLQGLLDTLLAKDPARRPRSAEHALQILGGAAKPRKPAKAPRLPPQVWLLVAMFLAILVGIGGGLVLLLGLQFLVPAAPTW